MYTVIDQFFHKHVADLAKKLTKLESAINPKSIASKDDLYEELVDALADTQDACRHVEAEIGNDLELIQMAQARFRNETARWFDQSWIGARARKKPRGYPGDHELLTAIYDQIPRSRGLGGYIDIYIMNLLLADSVRQRWRDVRSFLIRELSRRSGNVSILNIACGPCREFAAAIDVPVGCQVHLRCLDNDQDALDFVQNNIVAGSGITDFCCDRYNALRLRSSRATIRNFGRSDIVYSIGLFDYIPDSHLIGMLRGLRESLADGGVLYIAFKDTEKYDKTPYQWYLDWHFLQRTEEDCRQPFYQAGFEGMPLEMHRDDTGAILNFISRATVPARLRVDGSETVIQPLVDPRRAITPSSENNV